MVAVPPGLDQTLATAAITIGCVSIITLVLDTILHPIAAGRHQPAGMIAEQRFTRLRIPGVILVCRIVKEHVWYRGIVALPPCLHTAPRVTAIAAHTVTVVARLVFLRGPPPVAATQEFIRFAL